MRKSIRPLKALLVVVSAIAAWLLPWRRPMPKPAPVSEQPQRPEQLNDEPALMRTLLDLMPDYIYAKDADGRFVLANLAVARGMGAQTPEELIGKSNADFYPPEMAAGFRATEEAMLRTGLPMRDREELTTNRQSGGAHWYLSTKVPLRDDSGKVIGLVGISRDIHRRKQAEEEIRRLNDELDQRVKERTAELAAERKLLRTLIDNMPDLIYAKNADGRFILANRAVAASMGSMPDQLIGRSDFDFYPLEKAQGFYADERRVMESGQAMIGHEELALDASTGIERWLQSTKVPLRADDGSIVGIVGISREIAEIKRIQHELTQHGDRLQELVAERTAELNAAKELAEAANEAKSRFLANMSHELRTPLNAVLGYAQILKRDEGLSERQLAGLNTIEVSGDHLLAVIDDILDLAKVEAGRLELHQQEVQLTDLLRVISNSIRVKAQDKGLRYSTTLPADLPHVVRVDQKRLRQVLLNLLSNAVKFTDRGEVVLQLSILSREAGAARLRFEVRDTGSGIPDVQLETIFQPFEQANASKRHAGGTGLGLAISRQLARLMGGEVLVQSQAGQGSRFWFDIDVPIVAAQPSSQPPPGLITGYDGVRRRVLIADDVPGNRRMLSELLSSFGFVVTEAGDGEELLSQAHTELPDLVITDMVMPVMDGLEATAQMRRSRTLAQVPILVVSANASDADAARSLEAGANAFLPKPLSIEQLLQRMGQLLQLHWTLATTDEANTADAQFVTPGADELDALHGLARFGNMRSIRERAELLGAADERYRPFADQLCKMADRFQSRAILEFIERCRNA